MTSISHKAGIVAQANDQGPRPVGIGERCQKAATRTEFWRNSTGRSGEVSTSAPQSLPVITNLSTSSATRQKPFFVPLGLA